MSELAKQTGKQVSLVERFAERFSLEPSKLMATLKATAFKQRGDTPISNEQMAALLVVAEQYGLNPFTRELYAFPDKQNGIVPVVSVDGWTRIINSSPMLDGIEFEYGDSITIDEHAKPCPEWVDCLIYRKDRSRPIKVRENLDESYRAPIKPRGKDYSVNGPWQSHTKRMLRHKALIQCSRVAFGFSGIYDLDEAQVIQEHTGKTYEVEYSNTYDETLEQLKDIRQKILEGDWPSMLQPHDETWLPVFSRLTSAEKAKLKKADELRCKYRDALNDFAENDDELGALQEWGELNEAGQEVVYRALKQDTKDYIDQIKNKEQK